MGVIWTSRTRTRQPQGFVPFGNSSIRPESLVLKPDFVNGVDRVAGTPFPTYGAGTSRKAGIGGVGIYGDGSQASTAFAYSPAVTSRVNSATSLVVQCVISLDSLVAPGAGVASWGDDDNYRKFLMQPGSSGQITWGTRASAISMIKATDGGILSVGKVHCLVGLWTGSGLGSRLELWVDGAAIPLPNDVWMTGWTSDMGTVGSLAVTQFVYTGSTGTVYDATVLKNTVPSTEVLKSWSRNPWQPFAPERRPKFFSVGSGANTYAVGISETATASETVSMLANFGASISETATASETVATTAVLNASISETATASETVSMAASFVVTVGETATASETVAMALGAATFAVDISETATASETVSMRAAFGTSISETATASETVSMLATFLVGISETATASETVAMQLANQTYAVSISETATASDTVVMTIPTTYAISIIETVQAGDYVSMGVPSSDFWTQVTTTQSAGWGQINNTQSSGWTIIPTT